MKIFDKFRKKKTPVSALSSEDQIEQRRDRLYSDIAKLEEQEAKKLQQGKENTSAIVRKRLAAQISQIRKDIGRFNATSQMLNQQLNVISTNAHNKAIVEHCADATMPTTTELTEHAVQAEQLMESLASNAGLIGGFETEIQATQEELDILAEFEEDTEVEVKADVNPDPPVVEKIEFKETEIEDDAFHQRMRKIAERL